MAIACSVRGIRIIKSMNNETCASSNERSHTAGARLSQDNINENTAAARAEKSTYRDALAGRVPVPSDELGFFVFQTLMVGGMVTFMATLNGVRHDGLGFVAFMHWFYPVVFFTAFLIRRSIGNAVTGFVIPHFIVPRFSGAAASVAKCVANVGIMCPLVCLAVSILLDGADFLPFYLSTLPVSFACAVAANFFVVGPAVKTFYANHIAQRSSTKILGIWQRYARTLTALFGLS